MYHCVEDFRGKSIISFIKPERESNFERDLCGMEPKEVERRSIEAVVDDRDQSEVGSQDDYL